RLKIARYGQEATVPSPFCTEIKQARCLNLAFSALSSLFSLASGNFQTGSKANCEQSHNDIIDLDGKRHRVDREV
ncbi:hypothetical protein ACNRC9_08220, partial [Ralstonia pseudosolanacearum]|uniref:hypothetical protein n=1 Tax=Ralstonia pseudosolanacearum TaxID=1310165 RepID=UPI003AAE1B65